MFRTKRTPDKAKHRLALRFLVSLTSILVTVPSSGSGAVRGIEGVPSFRHVVVVVLENENFSETWGRASKARYLNSLVKKGVFADQYYATGHASLSNYIAMMSGQPAQPLTSSDCAVVSLWVCAQGQLLFSNGRNFADQLEEKHVSWRGYMDGAPTPCFHAEYSPTSPGPDPYQGNSQKPPAKDYADRHNPFIYFPDIIENRARCNAHVRPYAELARDIKNDTVPRFSFITPDTCHDGHDDPCSNGEPGGLISADKWLSKQLPSLIRYLNAHDGLLILTLDENGFTDTANPPGCCNGGLLGILPGFGGRIGLLALSPRLHAGHVVSTPYDHMSLLRTLEDSFGIAEHLNNAEQSVPMSALFR